MNRILQVFYIIFSSLLIAAAIPNELLLFGSPVLAIFALVPFYFVYVKQKSYIEAALNMALLTFMTQLFSSWWLGCFKEFALVTLFFTCFGTSLMGAAAGLVLFMPFAKTVRTRTLREGKSLLYTSFIPMRSLYFTCVYIFYEHMKSIGFLGYPWGTLSMGLYRVSPLIQIADITGTYGISFFAAFFSSLVAEYFMQFVQEPKIIKFLVRKKTLKLKKKFPQFISLVQTSILFLVLLGLSLVYGFYRLIEPRKPVKYIGTVMVQQNRDPWKEKDDNEAIRISEDLTEKKLSELKEEGKKADLVVWSEGCLRYAYPSSAVHYKYHPSGRPLTKFIKETSLPFILGGSYVINDSPRQSVNATLLFDDKGEFRGFYGKMHLVPFAEVVPFADIPKVALFLKNKLKVSTGWHPGNQYVYYDIKGSYPDEKIIPPVNVITLKDSAEEQKKKEKEKPLIRISTPICYDDSFPDVCTPMFLNGSELLINLTDDSWSMQKSSEYQHFVVSSFRAIELRIPLARSTNSGYSCVISPTGKVLFDMPLFEECAGFYNIPVYERKKTIYSSLGSWLPWAIRLSLIVLFFFERERLYEPEDVPSERKIKKGKRKTGSKKKK